METKCKRNGCKKAYNQNENNDQACKHHPGKPIFSDLKKGWTCCNKIVYDWDEFMKIEPCAVGKHTNVEDTEGGEFYQSKTVQNAQKGIDNFADSAPQPVRKIDDYNREEAEKKKLLEQQQAQVQKQIFVTPTGKYKCTNKGCLKEYDPKENTECFYHPGEPCFHDLKKFWTCCKVEKYDWDEFMKIPTCAKGSHTPKVI
ncbi:unnamed protein product (macronuclear) [Paramecium tetraurelia]|uniref:CHORD domain-containing protein n=1 Tax=Paramecium tetraurelia TaxID=5888 RepID=A0C143_PARTE|nr:uncharacterized protein GSPATT00033986001 [Paramecium tetraurelia]CAK64510.1 unnamed protein product [Paramecium tetraurelia]|eukprot:XP_001431908.1 hypothetical protein (macronuclear) [Paramecium tetraurelia strain d4-2]